MNKNYVKVMKWKKFCSSLWPCKQKQSQSARNSWWANPYGSNVMPFEKPSPFIHCLSSFAWPPWNFGNFGILEFWKDKRQSASLMRPSCLFQGLLFNVSKPFSLGSGSLVTTEDLMVDCFVSSFRINYRNNQHFDMCLQPSSPFIYQLAYVKGTYSIVKQV